MRYWQRWNRHLEVEKNVVTDGGAGRVASGVTRGRQFKIEVDGEPVAAFEGETVASALLASGRSTLRLTNRRGEPRGIFCGMGVCFDCVMTIDGIPNVRTCVTQAEPGMKVQTQRGLPEVANLAAD